MNVVGRVGSLISQGVYSVATPFHPFGGAVDVIVVQQQDGTFRSTPWYVRFGKFQGVLKGSEKVVRITVNGVEANFHMYLDNSGEAYFIKEVDSGKGTDANEAVNDTPDVSVDNNSEDNDRNQNILEVHRLEHSVSDSGVVQIREEHESDGERRFYDFQDEQSVELSEYGSGRYENLDSESFVESQNTSSEMILVSVDGHVLTAPISVSEKDAENVQLNTPQFHLGPGEGPDLVEGNEGLGSGENVWAAEYISQLNVSTSKSTSDYSGHNLEVGEGEGEHVCQGEETSSNTNHGCSILTVQRDSEDILTRIEKEDLFKSCLELPALAQQIGSVDSEEMDSSSKGSPVVDGTKEWSVSEFRNNELSLSSCSDSLSTVVPNEEKMLGSKHNDSHPDDASDESVNNELKDGHLDWGPQRPLPGIECSKNDIHESHIEASIGSIEVNGSIKNHFNTKFEISLCGNELRAGMGLHAAAEAFEAHRVTAEEFQITASSIIQNENLIIRFGEKYLPWEKAAPIVLGMAAFGIDLPVDPIDAILVEQDESNRPREDESVITTTPSGRRWRLWPIAFRRVKTLEHSNSTSSTEDVFVDSESSLQILDPTPASQHGNESPHKQFVRTNVPTTEQIASLNLKEGQNMIAFTFSTRVLGIQKVDAHIYLWKWNARIVISDVDGTITKSDVLGQFMPLVGKDWTQSGVARLFCAIKENGYQLLFLSARAIVQAYLTRSFLLNLKQDGKTMPNGPVVISPDGLFPSLFREVIRRAPHEFKIACLEDIKKLFPPDYNPFYAGFGNRDTDELSYRKIGIPKGKIFIINPKGEVAISHRIDVKSYTSLHTLVNDMFPPTSLVEQEDFNSWNYWKTPLPEID